jgi:FkbM family methyltransferase
MTMERIVSTVVELVPQSIRVALRGKRLSPSRFANVIHSVLNRMPVERYPVLPCGGVLKGFRMRVDWKIHRSFAYGSWEPEVVKAVREHVAPGMTVLDVGAQSGFYSLLFSRLVGPEGHVVAFEPLPANFRLLEENLQLNGIGNVTVRREAVAERSGEMTLEFPHHEAMLVAGPVLEEDNQGVMIVKGVSLDDCSLCSRRPVDFIKMDVEGAELQALKGARKLIDAWHPCMIVELHYMGRPTGPHPAAVHLQELGYKIQWLNEVDITANILALWTAVK